MTEDWLVYSGTGREFHVDGPATGKHDSHGSSPLYDIGYVYDFNSIQLQFDRAL